MLKFEINENKIFYTNNIFKWLVKFKSEPNFLVITPLTKVKDLLDFKKNSLFTNFVRDLMPDFATQAINETLLVQNTQKINDYFAYEVLNYKVDYDKVFGYFWEVDSKLMVNIDFLKRFLEVANKFLAKQTTIVIVGFDDFKIIDRIYEMLNLVVITSNLIGELVQWNNVERLVFLDIDEGFEIVDRNKFKDWLELKTRTVLTIEVINNYFLGVLDMNSFLIDRALRSI